MSTERSDVVTFQGNPLTVVGEEVKAGDSAPAFRVVDGGFGVVGLADLAGKAVLISAVPSLDTPVCAAQTKRFNEEATALGDDVAVLTISTDLPFAQGRFCEAEAIGGVQVLSDAVWREFGNGYGILIKDMGLLARAVFVIDRGGRIAYSEVVGELTEHPDYTAALAALRGIA